MFSIDLFCYSLVKPQITFDDKLEKEPFSTLMQDNTKNIKKGINLGKENGLSLLLDAEVYDYAFSPQKGENIDFIDELARLQMKNFNHIEHGILYVDLSVF